MKGFKKLLTGILAATLIMGSSMTAFADETPINNSGTENTETTTTTPVSHTVSISKTAAKEHQYEIYQIFTGRYDSTSEQLADLAYGTNAKTGTTGAKISQADAKSLSDIAGTTYADDQAKITALKQFVTLDSEPVAVLSNADDGQKSVSLVEGYYIIKDKDNTLTGEEGYTLYVFTVLNGDYEITPKNGTVEHEKHVDDQNDSDADDHSELKDSADYDFGDSVPYTLTFKLPADYANYKSYTVEFYDDMSAGLTYNDDAKIYYGTEGEGTAISFSASDETSKYDGGVVYKATVENLKTAAPSLTAESVVTIKYTATLNENAVLGSAGNPNQYKVKFSNNPNGEGTGETPWDKNIVFTYQAIFNKIDGDKKPLTGADFKLYKKVNGEWVDVTTLNGQGNTNPTKTVSDNGDVKDSVFAFKGLDAGEYKIEEIKAPTGFNKINPIEFKINAQHELESDDPKLTGITTSGDISIIGDTAEGSFSYDVVNESGVVLPSTGGIGTTIFYIVGGLLIVAAAVFFVVRRKSDAE
jgi:fimbrial isopeptide formation D2 family protein/LPXTG-motif cell wall-anchored protein